ncbi:methyl-accepting chemotaxis protein [Vibrio stylophorae]|nr:methyl-accepting chemotaxis protein [Vibrio stylophorae]
MNLTLKQKLLAAFLSAILIACVSLATFASNALFQQTRDSIETRAQSLSLIASESISSWLEQKQHMIATLDFLNPYNEQAVDHDMLALKKAGQFSDIFFGRLNGDFYVAGLNGRHPTIDARKAGWFQQALKANQLIITPVYEGSDNKGAMVTIAIPMRAQEQVIGVVGGDVPLSHLQKVISQYNAGTNTLSMLVDSDGRLLSHPEPQWLGKNMMTFNPQMDRELAYQSAKDRSMMTVERDDEQKLYFFTPIRGNHWLFAIELDESTEEAGFYALLKQQIIFSIVFMAVVIGLLSWLVNYLFVNLKQVSNAMVAIAAGDADLTQRIEVHTQDEVGELARQFNAFCSKMHSMMSHLRQVSDELSSQADDTAHHAQIRAERISQQQGEINMVATAMTEMASATTQIASHAENTAHTSGETVDHVEQGRFVVSQSQQSITNLASEVDNATTVIAELSNHANNISSILSTIQDIADQTNLLALNAAIEAARAGEQGRGFAVVADEVRVLSQRTHASTSEIQQTIETLQQITEQAVTLMRGSKTLAETSVEDANSANDSLSQINQSVTRISDMATEIASAAEEQSAVTAEITQNTETVREVAEELAQEATDALNQANQLKHLATSLNQEIGRFKL